MNNLLDAFDMAGNGESMTEFMRYNGITIGVSTAWEGEVYVWTVNNVGHERTFEVADYDDPHDFMSDVSAFVTSEIANAG